MKEIIENIIKSHITNFNSFIDETGKNHFDDVVNDIVNYVDTSANNI